MTHHESRRSTANERRIVAASRLFDASWYQLAYPETLAAGTDPILHFVTVGVKKGWRPQLLFDPIYYKSRYQAATDFRNPLVHYIQEGELQSARPHPLFDPAWYRATYLHPGCLISSPLEHYTCLGRLLGLRPNRYLDPIYYLRVNRDVARSGIDPVRHFEDFGEAEGRAPSSEFHSRFVEARLPENASKATGRVLTYILENPGSEPSELSPTYDIDTEQKRRRLLSGLDPDRPTILLVSHSLGGGIQRQVDDFVNRSRSWANVLTIAGSNQKIELRCNSVSKAPPCLTFDPAVHLDDLVALLADAAVNRVSIHSAYDFSSLRWIIEKLSVPFDFMLNDYHVLSPQPHLTDSSGKFVGEDFELAADTLLNAVGNESRATSLRSWQRSQRWLLIEAARIIAPAEDVRARFLRRYPDLHITVVPDLDSTSPSTLRATQRRGPRGRARVALLGVLSRHKGYDLVLDVADLARRQELSLDFHLIGYSVDDARLKASGVSVSGQYEDGDLDQLIASTDVDLLWLPSQCPETYSYTLSAALRSGLPVLVSALGALPERIAGRAQCRAFAWDGQAEDWLKEILAMLGSPSSGPE
jgi:glycosyltransferase involved in cell wall biosynthesis